MDSYTQCRPPLLTIPLELRLQILTYLLHSPIPLSRITRVARIPRACGTTSNHAARYDTTSWRFETGGSLAPRLHPAILSVCRQLYTEAYWVLYRSNTVTVSVALGSTFEPVDVLGHWRIDEAVNPRWDPFILRQEHVKGLPDLRRFEKFEFNAYVDFSRRDRANVDNMFRLVVRQMKGAGLGRLRYVKLMVEDGSTEKRFLEDVKLWKTTLEELGNMRCKALEVGGDVPREVADWLMDTMVVDGKCVKSIDVAS